MPNAIPIDTRPSSPIQRLSKAYFKKNAVAKRISMTATQPTPRRPMSDSSSKASSADNGRDVVVACGGGGSGAIGGGDDGTVTGSGGTGLTGSGCGGGGSGRSSGFGSTNIDRPASAASSSTSLLLVFTVMTRATIGSTIAETSAASSNNARIRKSSSIQARTIAQVRVQCCNDEGRARQHD